MPQMLAAELLTPAGRADPYPIYRRLHALGPAVPIPGGAVVAGYAEVERALRDPRLLVEDAALLDRLDPRWREHPSRALLNNSMVFVNGCPHDRMRRLVSQAFTARRVDHLEPIIARQVGRLLDRLAKLGSDRDTVDFVAEFAFPLPVNVIGDLLGIPDADRPGFRGPIADLARAFELGWLHADLTDADRAAVELADYFSGVVDERRARPGTDLLSAMIAANRDGPLSREQLVANAVLLLLAGFETTVGLLGNGLTLLLQRPNALAALRERQDLAPAFVEEVLRYDTPVQLTGRRAGCDLRIAGASVPAGGSVIVLLGAANRDPRRFVHPDQFDPDREGNQPLSFSSGAHYCLGARLARLEARVALPAFLQRFPDAAIAGVPTRLDRFNLRAYATLPLTLG